MSTTTLASQRIASLLDENSFVEIGGLVTARATDFNLKQTRTPSDGVITGYGVIDGNLVYVYSQDASVLGGSMGEMHGKKIAHLYDLAMKMGAPVIGLIDSAGLRLQEATDALNAFGEVYLKQTLASGVIPQITAIFGNCGGGLALVSTLADFTFMEEKKARLFVNSPNALEGNEISRCDTSAAAFQSEKAGTVDVIADESAIFAQIRELIGLLPANNEENHSYIECEDDLNRVCPDLAGYMGDTVILAAQLADNQNFFETKRGYAREMVTGFIRLNGMTVGVVANRTEVYGEDGEVAEKFAPALTTRGCRKAADFISFCDAFEIPVLSLTNVKGFEANTCAERNMAREAARLTYAFANATVPKVNVIIGKAYGSAYVAMNSKAIGADMTFAWPEAEIGTMEPHLAAKIICDGQGAEAIENCRESYAALQNNVTSAAARGYVDTIIQAPDTRKYVIGAFEMLFTKREDRPTKKHGTV
ncbi:MAG: acyl-CoA carboxylase subunit beta [Lachnospiraceae bacterium]